VARLTSKMLKPASKKKPAAAKAKKPAKKPAARAKKS